MPLYYKSTATQSNKTTIITITQRTNEKKYRLLLVSVFTKHSDQSRPINRSHAGFFMVQLVNAFVQFARNRNAHKHTHTQTKESKPILDKQIFKVSLLLWFYYGIFMVTRYVCPLIFLFIPCDHYECDRLVAIRTPIVWCGVLSVWRNAWMRCNCCLLPELNGYGGAEAVPPLFIFQS